MIPYDNPDYARERLNNTIVRLDGQAIKVIDITGRGNVRYCPLRRLMDERDTSLDKLDITPVPLGYVNSFIKGLQYVSYLTRQPVRRYKQGLDLKSNAKSTCGLPSYLIPSNDLADTIEGVYPDFHTVVKELQNNNKIESKAFSRDFSLYRDSTIWYKGMFCVGNWDGKFYQLKTEFIWLQEAIDEVLL